MGKPTHMKCMRPIIQITGYKCQALYTDTQNVTQGNYQIDSIKSSLCLELQSALCFFLLVFIGKSFIEYFVNCMKLFGLFWQVKIVNGRKLYSLKQWEQIVFMIFRCTMARQGLK